MHWGNMGHDIEIEIDISSGLNEGKQIYLFDPSAGGLERELLERGVSVRSASTGSAIMLAAKSKRLAGVIIAPDFDRELKDLFVAALKTQFRDIPIVMMVPGDNALAQRQAQEDGADHVLTWPSAAPLNKTIGDWFGAAHVREVKPLSPRVTKKAVAITTKHDAPQLELVSKEELDSVIKVHRQQSTTLRSELTLVREHSKLLKKRISRVEKALSMVLEEKSALELQLKQANAPEADANPLSEIAKQAENFVWGLEQTISLLEELAFEAGPKAPVLKHHVKIVNLTRNLLMHVQQVATKEGDS